MAFSSLNILHSLYLWVFTLLAPNFLISGKFCMALLVGCLHKFKLVVSNYQGLHRYTSVPRVILLLPIFHISCFSLTCHLESGYKEWDKSGFKSQSCGSWRIIVRNFRYFSIRIFGFQCNINCGLLVFILVRNCSKQCILTFLVPGSNQGNNNLTLKGWPLTVRDHFFFINITSPCRYILLS